MSSPPKAETILSSFIRADSIVNTRNEGEHYQQDRLETLFTKSPQSNVCLVQLLKIFTFKVAIGSGESKDSRKDDQPC